MKKALLLTTLICSLCLGGGLAPAQASGEPVYWTVYPDGVSASGAGSMAMHISSPGTQPEPVDAAWSGCDGGFVWFHRPADNLTNYPDAQKNAMLSLASAAYLAGKPVRVVLTRDSANKCYTSFITLVAR